VVLRRDDGDVRAWLFSILHNQFISRVRRDRRRGRHDASMTSMPARRRPGGGAARRDMLRSVEALSTISARVLLVGIEGLSYDRAASVLKNTRGQP